MLRGQKPIMKPMTDALSEVPPLPASLPRHMEEDWRTVAGELCERRLLCQSTLGPLEAYVRAIWMSREAAIAIEQHGMVIITEGKNKTVRNNPANVILNRSQLTIAKLAAELGLTPASRSRSGATALKPVHDDADDLGL